MTGPPYEMQVNMLGQRNPIPWVVKKLNGKSLAVDVDKEFDRAVEEVRKTLPSGRR